MARVVTALVSDLHLGASFGTDVLRRPGERRVLFEALEGVDQVVLLGDTVELRHGRMAVALEAAGPFFEELGAVLDGRRAVFVPGNHDHHLAGELLERRDLPGENEPLGLEKWGRPDASPALEWIAERMRPAEVELAYPGLWVRPDVYATHGHYLDAHLTVPRVECLAIGAVEKLIGALPDPPRTPDDYEAVLSPVYALAHRLAQSAPAARGVATSDLSARVWNRVATSSGRDLTGRLLGEVGIPAAVAALNRAGFGPFSARLSGWELRRAGLEAMSEVVAGLGIEADHVIFGHTHRPGPLDGEEGFGLPGGAQLTNCGSWIEDPALGDGASANSPYRPGVLVRVEDTGPPRIDHLLDPPAA